MSKFLGIDIGARSLYVAHQDKGKPVAISLDGDWVKELLALCEPGQTIAVLEPTGWAYSAPIVRALQAHHCEVWYVPHSLTGQVRAAQISDAKNDSTDARALRRIAQNPTAYRGVNKISQHESDSNTRLRLLCNSYNRAHKEATRSGNRIRQLAHSLHPRLGMSLSTYSRAAEHGYISPDQLRQLATAIQTYRNSKRKNPGQLPSVYLDGKINRYVLEMVAQMPAWLHDENVTDIIADEVATYRHFEDRCGQVEEKLISLIDTVPEWSYLAQLWMTIPMAGIAAVACLISATKGNVHQIGADQFSTAIGAHPKLSQSGQDAKSVASKTGFKLAKSQISLWTNRLINAHDHDTKPTPNIVGECFNAHKARNHKGAFYAARAKLGDILYGIARTGTPYDPARHPHNQNQKGN